MTNEQSSFGRAEGPTSYRDACKASDHYGTPRDAYELLLPFVETNSVIWDPCFDDGSCADVMRDVFGPLGCTIAHEDRDYRTWSPKHDIVVTNCAWSQKYEVLDWLLNHHCKPFAMLMPMHVLVAKKFKAVRNSDQLQIIFPTHRIHYRRDGAVVKGCSFDSCWITHGMKLRHDVMWGS